MENNKYVNLVEAVNGLKTRGYDINFEVTVNGKLKDPNDGINNADEVSICEYHRFEGMTDPEDASIIYAIETTDGKKGILIDAYGMDASTRVADFLKSVDEPKGE